jgi:hypothetical protein
MKMTSAGILPDPGTVSARGGSAMAFGVSVRRVVDLVNAGVLALTGVPALGPRLSKHITSISYTGRKSGRSFTLPVAYRRTGDTVRIWVGIPDKKNWWRNFLGAGGPMSIELDGAQRTGHAVSSQDERGRVEVVLVLDALS